jgi:hypothetical protein
VVTCWEGFVGLAEGSLSGLEALFKVDEVSIEVSTLALLGAGMSEEFPGLEEATMMTSSSLSINTLKTVGENV